MLQKHTHTHTKKKNGWHRNAKTKTKHTQTQIKKKGYVFMTKLGQHYKRHKTLKFDIFGCVLKQLYVKQV